jgi:putative FmdB family regulatory protein
VPIYEYRCNECGHHFERAQRMSDDPVRECEVCEGRVERVLFAPAIHFKGTGFYNTDYGRKRHGKDGEASGGGGPSDGAASTEGGGTGGGEGAAKGNGGAKAKEATPKDTASRATGP